ncbi:hypothetical protein [Dishui lake virophage 1]|nr:hypothetical protein [Dishui lake virophage 1]QIG59440.1 hypothetical protein [Dishui Lake virophage 7]
MEGSVAYYEVSKLHSRIKQLEEENAELKKKLETSTAERLGFRSVSFGSPFMEDPVASPTCVPRGAVWKPHPNPNWRVEGI